MNVWVGLMREASPGRKLDVVRSLSRTVTANAKRALGRANPEWDGPRLDVEFVRHCYGDRLAGELASYLGVRR